MSDHANDLQWAHSATIQLAVEVDDLHTAIREALDHFAEGYPRTAVAILERALERHATADREVDNAK